MTDGNTARAFPPVYAETTEQDGFAPTVGSSVPAGNDKVSRAIADGLMVLPDDDGLPPLLKKKMRGLSAAPDRDIAGGVRETGNQKGHDAMPASPLQQAAPEPAVEQRTGAVVTPHPAVFRSLATPLALHPTADRHTRNMTHDMTHDMTREMGEFAAPKAPPMPAGQYTAGDAAAAPRPESDPAMHTATPSHEHLKAVPPSLHAVKDTLPLPPADAAVAPVPAPAPAHQSTAPATQRQEPVSQPAAEPAFAPAPEHMDQQAPWAPLHNQQAAPQGYMPPQQTYAAPQSAPQTSWGYPPAYYPQPYPQPAYYSAAPAAYAPAPAPMPPMTQVPQVPPMPYMPAVQAPPAYAYQQPAPVSHSPHSAAQGEAANGAQLLTGLLQYLPPPGHFWSEQERKNWLDAAATLFDLAYGNLDPADRGQRLSRTNHRVRDR